MTDPSIYQYHPDGNIDKFTRIIVPAGFTNAARGWCCGAIGSGKWDISNDGWAIERSLASSSLFIFGKNVELAVLIEFKLKFG